MTHEEELSTLTQTLIDRLRKTSLVYLCNPICGTCATEIYLRVVSQMMVAAHLGNCDMQGATPDIRELFDHIREAWEDRKETLQ